MQHGANHYKHLSFPFVHSHDAFCDSGRNYGITGETRKVPLSFFEELTRVIGSNPRYPLLLKLFCLKKKSQSQQGIHLQSVLVIRYLLDLSSDSRLSFVPKYRKAWKFISSLPHISPIKSHFSNTSRAQTPAEN